LIKREWRFPLSFLGTVIDIETTGLDPRKDEIITYGIFSAEVIRIYQRTDPTPEGLKRFERFVSRSFDFLPRPYCAYKSEFEEAFLKVKIDHDLFKKWSEYADLYRECSKHGWFIVSRAVDEGCPKCGEHSTIRMKWPKLAELITMPHEYFETSLEADGEDVPDIWREYVKTREKSFLLGIIYHNLYDLLRSACLILWDETILGLISDILELEQAKPRILFAKNAEVMRGL